MARHQLKKDPTPCLGKRGDEFRAFVSNLLTKGKLKEKYINILTDSASMDVYTQVFTHISIDQDANYERFEILGDVTCNKFLVWYFSRRFPKLFSTTGVKILAELKIKYGSKIMFAPIARENGFVPYISAIKGEFDVSETSLCEDVFEAFIGATEFLLDTRIRFGVGYAICYNILEKFFEHKHIGITYQELHPPISRLKELFDRRDVQSTFKCNHTDKQKLTYTTSMIDEKCFRTEVSTFPRNILLGCGTGSSKVASENNAASNVLQNLRVTYSITDDDKARAYNI